jgi:4-hydroxy-tetrahydrodipicolinate reductase
VVGLIKLSTSVEAVGTPKTASATPLRIAVAGAAGKMGQMLIEAICKDTQTQLVGAFEHPTSPALGRDAGANLGLTTGAIITADIQAALSQAQFLIDFTRPEATVKHLEICSAKGIKVVIGTTGFDKVGKELIALHSAKTAIMFSANMSVGVNATVKVLELAAKILNQGFDVEVIEAHHKHKIDAPSGTALMLGEAVAKATGRSLDIDGVFTRYGTTGPRPENAIGFSVIRGGDIVGDHTVLFAGTGERIEITHKSSSRMTYALGAVRACKFLTSQNYGLFDMNDVLGLN